MRQHSVSTFDGKGVIVTGGAGGIGEAICLAFLREGARVLCADNRSLRPELISEAETICESGCFGSYLVDVTESDQCRAILEDSRPISILVNCAGVQPKESAVPAHELSEEMWDLIMDVVS